MRIPETVIYSSELPASECLVLLPGAVIGSADDTAERLLREEKADLSAEATVRETVLKAVAAKHILFARAERLDADNPNGAELLKKILNEAVIFADALGVTELSFLSLPTEKYNSRLFAMMTVFFRELMREREKHPCLTGIRFLCPDREAADWIARVYNFYYPADKSERMIVSDD